MSKKSDLTQKLNDFVNNFELNTPKLNNIKVEKEILLDKFLNLLVQNVCITKLDNNEYYSFKNKECELILNTFTNSILENNVNTILDKIKTLKQNLEKQELNLIKKNKFKKNTYNLLNIFDNTYIKNVIHKQPISTNNTIASDNKIKKLETKHKPKFIPRIKIPVDIPMYIPMYYCGNEVNDVDNSFWFKY